jgi:hypothetical protein
MVASGASALRASIALKRSLAMTKRKANELGFPFRTDAELRKEQAPIAGDIIAMGSQAGNVFVHHRRHPLTVVTAFPFG